MKKTTIASSAPKACCAASKCVCDKETKKLVAEKAKLEKALASANDKALKAAQGFAAKIAKANEKIAKLQATVADLRAKSKKK
jgi:hypothetical protein